MKAVLEEIENPVPSLRAIAHALAIPRDRIESTFVRTGASLSDGSAMLSRIGKVLAALATRLDSAELREASIGLAEVGRRASEISNTFGAEQVQIDRLGNAVEAARHPISSLRRSVKMMDIIAINARVVAAGIVGDRDDFDVFTSDIAELAKSANASIQAFTAVYQKLVEDVAEAAAQHGRFQTAHGNTLQSLAGGLKDALEEVANQRRVASEGGAATRTLAIRIMGRIASAVMALQVGDATRQRIEHIELGINALSDLLNRNDIDEGERAFAKFELGRLHATQLGDAANSFESEVFEASTALQSLAADAGSIMDHSRTIYAAEGRDAGKPTPLASLAVAVAEAVRILQDCETARGQLERTAAAVLDTVVVLMDHVEIVQEVEANMRLVSLNAAVKCAQLGPSGAPLNVIARLLRELTGETVLSAEDAMSKLTTATELARSFGDTANGESTARISKLEEVASAALDLLTVVDKSLLEARHILESEGPKTISILADAAEEFSSQLVVAEYIRDQQIALVAECPAAEPFSGSIVAEAAADHWRHYTMDAERRVHEVMFGSTGQPEASSETVQEDDLDGIMF